MTRMHDATLVYLLTDSEVLLAQKKDKNGFGGGFWNGAGGKVEPEDNSIEHAAVREISEEILVNVDTENLRKVATFDFFFPWVPESKKFDQRVHVYITRTWNGEPSESDEMIPKWFSIDSLLDEKSELYDNMWPDDRHWLPRVLKGEHLTGTFIFAEDGSISRYRVDKC